MKKRYTITAGPEFQKKLAKLARKYSLETNTGWNSQEALERLLNIGMTEQLAVYYPKEKQPAINS